MKNKTIEELKSDLIIALEQYIEAQAEEYQAAIIHDDYRIGGKVKTERDLKLARKRNTAAAYKVADLKKEISLREFNNSDSKYWAFRRCGTENYIPFSFIPEIEYAPNQDPPHWECAKALVIHLHESGYCTEDDLVEAEGVQVDIRNPKGETKRFQLSGEFKSDYYVDEIPYN